MKFAIIGMGKMGYIRAKALRSIGGHELMYFSNSKHETSYILKEKEIDAVIICTPNHLSKNLVIDSLQAGKHVFCEKPPGRNLEELEDIIQSERLSGKKLMFGFNHRHHESMIHAKRLIESENYGKILWMRGRYGKSVDKDFSSSWRANKELAGGGIFLDQGIHMLDLFLMFCEDFDKCHSFVSKLYWKSDIEDNVFAIFKNSKTGQVASLHSTMTQWRHLFSLEIFLERGYITINGLKTSSNTYGEEGMTIARNRSLPPSATWEKEENIIFPVDKSWQRELEIFIDCVERNQEVPIGNSKDAHKLMTLVDKVYKGGI